MAVVKSDIVTSADDLDVQVESHIAGLKRSVSALYSAAGALSDNDVILFVEVPVDARLPSIKFASDDLGTTGDINIGFYPGKGSGTTIAAAADAVDEDAIGSAIDVNAAAVAQTEIRYETKDINTVNSKAWELAGLSSKPDYATFYIAGTMSEASTAAGDLTLEVEYVV